jgi:uncharacterized protein YhfF
MNHTIKEQAIQAYWQQFCDENGLDNISYKEAFQFGAHPDWLASLVVDGTKTATCSSYPVYGLTKDPLPQPEEYSIVLNGNDIPVAIIQTYDVKIIPFKDIPEEFALAEGEGTYQQWKEGHIEFFSNYLVHYKLVFDENMLTVCERFEKVYG